MWPARVRLYGSVRGPARRPDHQQSRRQCRARTPAAHGINSFTGAIEKSVTRSHRTAAGHGMLAAMIKPISLRIRNAEVNARARALLRKLDAEATARHRFKHFAA